MSLSTIVNEYGKKYSPYKSKLVNNLSMGQLALFKISGDLNKVKHLTEHIVKRGKINTVKEDYPKLTSMEECLGKRELYESCLDIIKSHMRKDNGKEYIKKILNTYPLGMSSGLFHTLIRLYYAVDAYEEEDGLIDEVARSLAYYITAYREGDLFQRKINSSHMVKEMEDLRNNNYIKEILKTEDTIGHKIRALYNDEKYLQLGFTLEDSEREKIEGLLELLLPAFLNSRNIVVQHCITGLQALVGLREYYDDFSQAIDILTTTIITHLLTVDKLDFTLKKEDTIEFSWQYIISLASESTDVHNIKLANSCRELYKLYPMKELKRTALKRLNII